MKFHPVSRWLRGSAVVVAIVGLALWVGAGARFGWTQTSIVRLERDEVTGIEYPVRQAAFRPGVEVPLVALAGAGVLAGLSWGTARKGRRLEA